MEIKEIIEFNGKTYQLMGGKRKYYLSQSTTNKGRKSPKGLHVAIWEFYNNKEVSKGFVIHHKDGNQFNNDISNLDLVEKSKHNAEHKKERYKENSEKQLKHLESIRGLTKEWHASPEGKERHRNHWEETKRNLFKKNIHICIECGKEYETNRKETARFCSQKCGEEYRKFKKICERCGKDFKTRKQLQKGCSFYCSIKIRNKASV